MGASGGGGGGGRGRGAALFAMGVNQIICSPMECEAITCRFSLVVFLSFYNPV